MNDYFPGQKLRGSAAVLTHHKRSSLYRALYLTERLPVNPKSLKSGQEKVHLEAAHSKLAQWKEQLPFEDKALFQQRLELAGLCESEVLSLLAEPEEALQARLTPPGWLVELEQVLDNYNWHSHQKRPFPWPTGVEDTPTRLYLELVRPWLEPALLRSQTALATLGGQQTALPFEPAASLSLFLPSLASKLARQLNRTLALEVNLARLKGQLAGESGEERFQNFICQLTRPVLFESFLNEYPVLIRALQVTVEYWTNNTLELLTRLARDWPQIQSTFSPDHSPGRLVAVEGEAGDSHRGGQSVQVLKFSSGLKLVYKPRSLSLDFHFQELLEWLNRLEAFWPLRTLKILDRGDYGWTEFVEHEECNAPAQVERFYERLGGYLALLYALEATDFHSENLIATGEQPMLVDLEALFHPQMMNLISSEAQDPAAQSLANSVCRVGLLPERAWGEGNTPGVEISGMGGRAKQLIPKKSPALKDLGTDTMQVVRQQFEFEGSHNRPILNGVSPDLFDYYPSFITGFEKMYRLLLVYRQELLTALLPRFASDQVRVIVRPTNTYARLLQESYHPDLLRNSLERDRFFDRLWQAVATQPGLAPLLPYEQVDLHKGDIPIFTTLVNGRDLVSSQGEPICSFLNITGLEAASERLRAMSPADLIRQLWFIVASFTTLEIGMNKAVSKASGLPIGARPATPARLETVARAIGDRLIELACRPKEEQLHQVNWLSIYQLKNREWKLLPARLDLYQGTSGIAFFLAYLGELSGERRYQNAAEAAVQTVRQQLEDYKKWEKHITIGGFEGVSSVLYLYSHLARLWGQLALVDEACEIAKWLTGYIYQDRAFDLIGGAAGAILSLLSLYRVRPTPAILEAAILCGDHLIQQATPMAAGVGWVNPQLGPAPLTGMAHGAAGIAYSLVRLGQASGEGRFTKTARAAIDYERSLFSPQAGNWPDLRKFDLEAEKASSSPPGEEGIGEKFSCAWCHGASGIGLARLACLEGMEDSISRAEIEAAYATTLQEGFGLNHSLCHGDLGNLEFLLLAAARLDQPKYKAALTHFTCGVLESIQIRGCRSGVALGVETSGLMTGLAGIGYGLLRLAYPAKVPSVQLLAPPSH